MRAMEGLELCLDVIVNELLYEGSGLQVRFERRIGESYD